METQTTDEKEKKEKTLEEKQLDFEKYKTKIELLKWFIVSVALVGVTMLIDYKFKDRETGMKELQQYDKYVTDLLVLNTNPVQKRMLAQFFATVTPSTTLRDGWEAYYKLLDKEYQRYIYRNLKFDSILKEKYLEYALRIDSLTDQERKNFEIIKMEIEENEKIINPGLDIPGNNDQKDFNSAIEWESKGFQFLLNKDVNNAIIAFKKSEDCYNQFHQVYEIAKYLSENIDKLSDQNSTFWNDAYKKIVSDFSWKMPANVLVSMANN